VGKTAFSGAKRKGAAETAAATDVGRSGRRRPVSMGR
jgi:hypothetical protein